MRNISTILKMVCNKKCVRLGWRMHRVFSKNSQYRLKNLIKSGLHVIKNDRLVEHGEFFIVNSFISPLNSDAFESTLMSVPGTGSDFFKHHTMGKRSALISRYIAVTAKCMYNYWHCSAAKRNPDGELDTIAMITIVSKYKIWEWGSLDLLVVNRF